MTNSRCTEIRTDRSFFTAQLVNVSFTLISRTVTATYGLKETRGFVTESHARLTATSSVSKRAGRTIKPNYIFRSGDG